MSKLLDCIWDAFNNASIGALIGAAAAFLLVVATDRRRNRRTAKRVLPAMLRRVQVLVDNRIEGAVKARDSVNQQDRPMFNTGLTFPSERIDRYADEVNDRLSDAQAFALSNITFYMREADRCNFDCEGLVRQIHEALVDSRRGEENARGSIPGLESILIERYGAEITLLTRTKQTIEAYLSGSLSERGGPLA